MKCPVCDGKGEYIRSWGSYMPCDYCNGTGEVWQTSEEWFCGLSTKEKAKVITDFVKRIAKAEEIELNINKEAWIRWLKQPHKE